jgi:hypothetical protein
VVDERGYYWKGGGWLSSTPGARPAHRFVRTGEKLGAKGKDHVLKATAGFVGYYAGPATHVVDPLGLTDPLLARLPAAFDPDWRTGHFRRHVPPGYVAAAGTDAVALDEPDAQALYDALARITRGPLFSRDRWRAIAAIHLGGYPVDPDPWRYPNLKHPRSVPARVRSGGAGFQAEPGAGVVEIRLGPPEVADEEGRAPWTVRADDGAAPLRTWSLPEGEHTLALPTGTQRLLFFARSPAQLSECGGCAPLAAGP